MLYSYCNDSVAKNCLSCQHISTRFSLGTSTVWYQRNKKQFSLATLELDKFSFSYTFLKFYDLTTNFRINIIVKEAFALSTTRTFRINIEPFNRPFSYSESECGSNDISLQFVEFSNVHNCDRSSNATLSSLAYKIV